MFDFIKDLDFRRIILKYLNEPSMKVFQEAMIHSCVGVEVFPQGPLEGDHMANGRVEMAADSVYTHFPKDPHCDICLKTKITRHIAEDVLVQSCPERNIW